MQEDIEQSFLEAFVFADDANERLKSLEQLTPSSEQFLYYAILHEQLLSPNVETTRERSLMRELADLRNSRQSAYRLLNLRRRLMSFDGDSEQNKRKTIQYIRDDLLQMRFNHQRQIIGGSRRVQNGEQLASVLNQEKLSLSNYLKNKTNSQPEEYLSPLGQFKHFQMTDNDRDVERMLNSLPSATHPLTMPFVRRVYNKHKQFDQIRISLTLTQMEALLEEFPQLRQDSHFVTKYLQRLVPTSELDIDRDFEAQAEYYTKLWSFALTLSVGQTDIKLALMHSCLDFDWKQHSPNKDRFHEYIKIPQQGVSFFRMDYGFGFGGSSDGQFSMDRSIVSKSAIHINQNMESIMPDQLIHNYLLHFLGSGANVEEYSSYLNRRQLRSVFIEARALKGQLDGISLTSDENQQIAELQDRIDLNFVDWNKTVIDSDDPILLEISVKNVKKLQMKVYEMNTRHYFTKEKQQIPLNMDLDGLSPSFEQEMDFSSIAPIVQHVEKLPLEELNGRCGVFIVDVVGGGQTSRALIKKGTLRFLERPTVNGQALLVLNEKNVVVSKERAAVWVDGVKYTRTAADDVIADLQPDEILIPFSTRSGRTSKQIILSDTTTGLCALKDFDHLSENYSFSCQIFVDREELIQFKTAHVLLRPSLHCNNTPSSVSLVENVIVTVKATDLDGIPTIKQFDDVVFVDNELTCLEVMIGDNLATFAVEVQGRVRIVSDLNRPQDVSASRSFHVNQINSSFGLVCCELQHCSERGYVLKVNGKAGEAISSHAVDFSFDFREYSMQGVLTERLATDANGEIVLGQLSEIAQFSATLNTGTKKSTFKFSVDCDEQGGGQDVEEDSPDQIVTVEGADTPIALPVRECDSDKLFLLSMTRDWTPLANCSQFLTVKNGLVIISGRAPAGDYTLFNWTSGSTVRVSVIRSTQQLRGTTVIGRNKIGVCRRSATAIERVSQTEDGDVKIRLLNTTPSTRVHVFLSSFQPVFDAQTNLALSNRVEDSVQILPNSISQFNSNKRLGTEQLYVLNRRAQPHKLGTTLDAPSILINPVVNGETRRKDAKVRDKERFSDSRPDDSSAGQTSKTMKSSKRHGGSGEHDRFRTTDEGTLDWMKTASLVKPNIPVQVGPHAEILLAGKDELGGRTVCTVIVTDEDRTLCRRLTLTLPPQPSDADDTNRTEVRMMQPFDGLKHFVETNTASLILPQSAFDNWPPPTASTLPHPSYTMIGKRSIQIGDMSAVKHSQFASMRGLFHLMVSIFGAESSSTQFARLKKFEELYGQLGGLTESEKVKRYSQMPCHETNLFFFHKAPALFALSIAPLLKNKKEKRIIDYFVTGSATESQLLSLIKPNVFAELNALEQILVVEMLVSILIGTKDPVKTEQAQSYALNFLLTVKHRVASRPENKEHDAKLFEIALKAGLGGDAGSTPKDDRSHSPHAPPDVDDIMSESFDEDRDSDEARIGAQSRSFGTTGGGFGAPSGDIYIMPTSAPQFAMAGYHSHQMFGSPPPQMMAPPQMIGRPSVPRMPPPPMMAAQNPPQSGFGSGGGFGHSTQIGGFGTSSPQMPPQMPSRMPPQMPGGGPRMHDMGIIPFGAPTRSSTRAPPEHQKQKQLQVPFRQADDTKEYRECEYYEENGAGHNLISWNRFWCDYAFFLLEDAALGRRSSPTPKRPPFASPNILDCHKTFTEAACALAVSDLSERSNSRLSLNVVAGDGGLSGIVEGHVPGLFFVKEAQAQEAEPSEARNRLTSLIVQEFVVDPADTTFVDEFGQRSRKYVSPANLHPRKAYTCDTILSNTSSATLELDILLQIPQGSMPVKGGFYTKTLHRRVKEYSSEILSYSFYFPEPGEFSHYPAHVMRKERIVAIGKGIGHREDEENGKLIVEEATDDPTQQEDLNSWTHLSQVADDAQLLDFLANGNLFRVGVDLSDICWRLKKKQVFEQVIAILEKRGVYNRDIWSYSLKHEGPIRAIEAFLSDRHNGFTRHIPKIQKIESSLYTSDPVANHAFNLYEYRPLINPRTFSLGTQKEIPNANLKQQYKQYLLFLAHRGRGHLPPTATKPLLCSDDKLIMSYYLILQDRLDEARVMFNQIPRSFGKEGRVDEEMAIQYAYMSGYLDFSTPWTDYSDDPSQHLAEARRVVAEFEHVKMRRWRDMFDELKRQLEIIDTAFLPIRRTETEDETDMILMEDESRREIKRQKQLRAAQKQAPSLAISLNKESFDVSITQQNGKDETALVKFYPVDIELLFSLNPFIRDRGEKCSSVTPSTTLTVPLSKEGDEISETTTVAIPTEFRNRNVMISVEYETLTKTVSSFDHSMAIDVFEQAGRLQVRDRTAKRPLPSVYVKAYMRKNKDDKGEFQKDGFTDLTGTFDYASVNKETRSTRGFAGARFSILVMSHNRGSDVIEVSAPAQ
ncbi:putative Actin-binding protein [Blattamonas nauphoetae]|uniref:Actin-binding protein n=1 Tax=Blattamonas nauphoetae TaxID=2049346 RepID=A0ABQ9Y0M6_9EUKA|nr:putative Actin-binding protein [Blattamonas nauphoetae]